MRQPAYPTTLPLDQLTQTGMSSGVPVVRAVYWESQPQSGGADAPLPLGQLAVVRGTYSDDAARPVQHTMTLDLAYAPQGLGVGNWVQVSLGLRGIQTQIYALPVMIVTEIRQDNTKQGGATVTAADPAEVLNGRPYETDTTLAGTLRDLVQSVCQVALTRVTDVSGVPAVPIPAETIAEFGVGSWDACLKTADTLGVMLRFTDNGDVTGHFRSDPPPQPVTTVERVLVPPGGEAIEARYPTASVILVTRGQGVEPLYGRASSAALIGPHPPWYPPFVLTDRHEGDATTAQADADGLAMDHLRAALGDQILYQDLSILPAPWLESLVDTVSLDGQALWVRGLSLELPSLATTISLRRVVP